MPQIIIGPAIPNIPWQEKPGNSNDIVWRYDKNPIIKRNPLPGVQSIYNSAVVPFKEGFAGVFRADSRSILPYLHVGFSEDAIHWSIAENRIQLICKDSELAHVHYQYDPRVVKIENEYFVTWCNGYHGQPTIGIAKTNDFESFVQLENAFIPFNRNGVLFPRKINGKYMMLSRPSDGGHTQFGDIYISESPDMLHWQKWRNTNLVLDARSFSGLSESLTNTAASRKYPTRK